MRRRTRTTPRLGRADPHLLGEPERGVLVDGRPEDDGVLAGVVLEVLAQRVDRRDDDGLPDGASQRLGDHRVEITMTVMSAPHSQ